MKVQSIRLKKAQKRSRWFGSIIKIVGRLYKVQAVHGQTLEGQSVERTNPRGTNPREDKP